MPNQPVFTPEETADKIAHSVASMLAAQAIAAAAPTLRQRCMFTPSPHRPGSSMHSPICEDVQNPTRLTASTRSRPSAASAAPGQINRGFATSSLPSDAP